MYLWEKVSVASCCSVIFILPKVAFSVSVFHSSLFCAVLSLSRVQIFATRWTVARQALLSMRFPRQKYWSRLPFLPRGDLPNPGMELMSLVSPALADGFLTTELPGKPLLFFRTLPFSKCPRPRFLSSLFTLRHQLSVTPHPA